VTAPDPVLEALDRDCMLVARRQLRRVVSDLGLLTEMARAVSPSPGELRRVQVRAAKALYAVHEALRSSPDDALPDGVIDLAEARRARAGRRREP
jgi:hypothetical protein